MKKRIVCSIFLVVMIMLSGSGFISAQAKPPTPGKTTPQAQPAGRQRPTTKPWGVKPIPAGPEVTPPSVPGQLIVGFNPALAAADLTLQSQNAADRKSVV